MSRIPIENESCVSSSDVINKTKVTLDKINVLLRKISDFEFGKLVEPWEEFQQDNVDTFLNKLVICEREQKNDLLIWKYYSQIGGIYDVLRSFEKAVTQPAINAFDFDEEENCYYIFITINNSLLSRLKEHVDNLHAQLEEASSYDNSSGDIFHEAKELLLSFDAVNQMANKIKEEAPKWQREFSEYKNEYMNLLKTSQRNTGTHKSSPKKFQNPFAFLKTQLQNAYDSSNEFFCDRLSQGDREEELLKSVLRLLRVLQREIDKYQQKLEEYNSWRCLFEKNYKVLLSYTVRYTSLYNAIKTLWCMTEEGGELNGLTCSPNVEEGVEMYMKLAEVFCEESVRITQEYHL